MSIYDKAQRGWDRFADAVESIALRPKGDIADKQVVEVARRFMEWRLQVQVRHNTLDRDLVNMILRHDSVYALPRFVKPKVIFDVGANIGIAAIYYACVYPNADIYCFEPLPDNLELLRENTSRVSRRIHVMPFGLSDREGTFTYHMSANPRSFGGGTFMSIGHDETRSLELPLRRVSDVLDELEIKQVDVFKVDTEGSELNILNAVPQAVRENAQAVIGELHGVGDWDVCKLLNESHAIEIDKRLTAGCFPFMAVRRDFIERRKQVLSITPTVAELIEREFKKAA